MSSARWGPTDPPTTPGHQAQSPGQSLCWVPLPLLSAQFVGSFSNFGGYTELCGPCVASQLAGPRTGSVSPISPELQVALNLGSHQQNVLNTELSKGPPRGAGQEHLGGPPPDRAEGWLGPDHASRGRLPEGLAWGLGRVQPALDPESEDQRG